MQASRNVYTEQRQSLTAARDFCSPLKGPEAPASDGPGPPEECLAGMDNSQAPRSEMFMSMFYAPLAHRSMKPEPPRDCEVQQSLPDKELLGLPLNLMDFKGCPVRNRQAPPNPTHHPYRNTHICTYIHTYTQRQIGTE